MSRDTYHSLIAGAEEAGLLGALGKAAALRRTALALATDEWLEGTWEAEAAQVEELGAPLLRLAADQGDAARYASGPDLEALGARGWVVRLLLEPTADGETLITVERLWAGEGAPEAAPALSVALLSHPDGAMARVNLPPEQRTAQVCAALPTTGRVHALVWRA